jgi:serine O-acetyltransferase
VLGPCKIGDNSLIGANTFVSFDVEPYSTVVGAKGRVVKKNNQKVGCPSEALDQIHMPDPISQEICRITTRIEHIEDCITGCNGAGSKRGSGVNINNSDKDDDSQN